MNGRTQRIVIGVAAILVAALTARLGVWQLDRAAQKIALQRLMDDRAALPALPAAQLAREPVDAAAQAHRRITVRGIWMPASTVYLDNRQMDTRVGFFVLTPLRLSDGSAVVVQRGWVPRDAADRTHLPALATPVGEVEVQGRIAPPPARLYELGDAGTGPIRQNLHLEPFARETGLALRPLSIQQESDAADGLLRHWPHEPIDVSRHHGYAFQWFALSALVLGLYVWFQLIRPRRRARA